MKTHADDGAHCTFVSHANVSFKNDGEVDTADMEFAGKEKKRGKHAGGECKSLMNL